MSYKIKDNGIKLIVRKERDDSNVNLFNYNLIALVEFEYKNIDYSETCYIDTLFTVEMEDGEGDIGFIEKVTSLKDPSEISKSDIDDAVTDRLDTITAQIDMIDQVKVLESRAKSYSYDYPMDI